MKTSFIHIRVKTPQGNILPNGGTTIAFQHDENSNNILYAIAQCNPHDNYNKAYGRMKAAGRLKSDKFCTLAHNMGPKEFLTTVHENYTIVGA